MSRFAVFVAFWFAVTHAEGRSSASFFAEDLRRRALTYFTENADPTTGLVRDRAPNRGAKGSAARYSYAMASIAATGFGVAVLAHAAKTSRMPRARAYRQIERTLAFVKRMPHYKGWLYHFIDPKTGLRVVSSEVSTIDTAIFLAGALYAASIYPGTQAARDAQELYERTDFLDMLTDGGSRPFKKTVSHGWTPESGYLKPQWDLYAEQMILLLLGIGHPFRSLPEAVWKQVGRPTSMGLETAKPILGLDLPLFVHQYSHLFVDFRSQRDRFANYFANSTWATEESRTHTLKDPSRLTYRAGFWGLSAGDSPTGYQAYSRTFEDGTVCPSCAGGSFMFAPSKVLSDMLAWRYSKHASRFWGCYGFSDSINLDEDWYSPDVIGITEGALYLSMVNVAGEKTIWSDFMRIAAIRRAFALALN